MSSPLKTRGELEAEISQAVIRFKKEFTGRGPLSARTHLIDDLAVVRLQGVLTAPEQRLAKLGDRGRDLVKQARAELVESGRPLLEAVVRDILGVGVVSLHTDVSTRSGESILLFTLDGRPAVAAG